MAFLIRLNAVLVALLIGSAFYLVHIQYQSRKLYTELDRAYTQARRLQVELEQLQVQKQAEATSARVQKIAVNQLKMHPPNPGITLYIESPITTARQPEAQ